MKRVCVLIYSCHLFCSSFRHLLCWCLCQHNDLSHCQAHLWDGRSHPGEKSQSQQLVGSGLPRWGSASRSGTASAAEQPQGSLTEPWGYGWKAPGLFSQCSQRSEPDLRIGGGEECKDEFLCVNHRRSISHVQVDL